MVLGFKPIKLANNEEETTYLVDITEIIDILNV